MQKISTKNIPWAYILFFLCLFCVISTHPFLKLPFDPWEHLIKIRSIFDEGKCFLYWPEDTSSFSSWHQTWATIFSILKISETFAWAKIIHCTQFIFALFSMFFFSFSVLSLCEKQATRYHLRLMAFFATLFWLVGNGTYSVGYQQAWIMWYSVTYQGITVPLFWVITALTLQLFFNNSLSNPTRLSFIILTMIGFLLIAFFHPSEAIYYAIYLFLCLLLTPLISFKQKIVYGCLLFTIVPGILFIIATHMNLPFLQIVSPKHGLSDLIHQVTSTGYNITERGGNRLNSSFSELAIVSSIAALIYWVTSLLFFCRKPDRILTLLTIALIIFFLIPTSLWLAGIMGLLLHKNIIWRFFFASPWFLFVPLIIYKINYRFRFPTAFISFLLIAILSVTFFISQNYLNRTLSGNMLSLYNSFFKNRVGLQYSEDDLALLRRTIEIETKNIEKRNVMLYLRSDLATLARALFGYYVYSHRRIFIPMHKFYTNHMDKKYTLFPITLPLDFPKDRNIFLKFKLDAKNISKRQTFELKGDNNVLFDLDHVDLGKKYLFIEGWAFIEKSLRPSVVFVTLQDAQESFVFDTSKLFRRDVGKYFRSQQLENKGFLATIRTSDLPKGTYQIGLLVKENDQQGYVLSKQSITVSTNTK